jgi:hypothetical protein
MEKLERIHVFILSLLGTILVFVLDGIRASQHCFSVGNYGYENICLLGGMLLLIFLPTLFIAIVTLFARNNIVFRNWLKFAKYYVPIYFLLVIATPWYSGDEFLNIQKETIALFLSVLYFAISLVILLTGWWKRRVK